MTPSQQQALFEFLAHGDEAHQQWLADAINAFFAGRKRPATVLAAATPLSPEQFVFWLLGYSSASGSNFDRSVVEEKAKATAQALRAPAAPAPEPYIPRLYDMLKAGGHLVPAPAPAVATTWALPHGPFLSDLDIRCMDDMSVPSSAGLVRELT